MTNSDTNTSFAHTLHVLTDQAKWYTEDEREQAHTSIDQFCGTTPVEVPVDSTVISIPAEPVTSAPSPDVTMADDATATASEIFAATSAPTDAPSDEVPAEVEPETFTNFTAPSASSTPLV